ncbi:MAG: UTP--glucose-1-phosphate uridylyltransferase [Verrucomicrobia bacterium]|nr:UTP--glucose-1-phosphate uridylyltransferase [Verrucomicrobiota bacterium]
MRAAGVATPTINTFLGAAHKVIAGERGMLPESTIEPIDALPRQSEIRDEDANAVELLQQLVVVKLNGGLGTGMGLDRAKSLIPVRGAECFLDFIARQILHLRRERNATEPAFYLMDSFSTQKDTVDYLKKYPSLSADGQIDFLQNMVPKLEAQTFEPISWPTDPELEWCPPGHGDLYPALLGCGLLDCLLSRGLKYMFVSNSDNLGATVDVKLVRYFADSGFSFLMEVAERTSADKKGGHLARRLGNGRLLLRESAQCPKEDEAQFQNIERHRYFNTNNLWIRLDHLKAELERNGGTISLPLITNQKTVDPQDSTSPKVLQLESAMGAAIECFAHTGAIVVPRVRFAPVKTTADLLALRSDAYRVTDDFRLVLAESRHGQPPLIDLDAQHYKLMAGFDACFANGAPSLINCDSLKVSGKMIFALGVVCEGKVEFSNASSETKTVATGTYRDVQVRL